MKAKFHNWYTASVLAIAVLLAYLVMQHSFDATGIIIPVSKFMEILIPVLGIASLLKYLMFGGGHCYCKDSAKDK